MTQAGKYLLLDRIAKGGMAEIYRAKQLGVEGFEKIVALKRILPELAGDAEFVAMFVQEAKIAGQLSHANIAPIYELGKMGDTHFIAMEYVWGKDVRQILKRWKRIGQPMPPPMAAWIASKMLEALDYAHRKRGMDGRPLAIIHRDVSPQNVLVSYEGLVRLIDFGIAKAASRATQTQAGVIKGKLAYMSPEQVMGRPLDHRSDVFAASSCLHEMLTGEPAFKGASDIEVIDKVREARVPPPSELAPHVSAELEAIVMKGLAREPNDRFQTAGEMQEAIMRLIAMSRPPYGTTDLSKWMRVAFAPEIAEERAHLERLSDVAQPGVSVAQPKRAAQPAQVVSRESSGVFEELSQLVVVEDLELEASLSAFEPSRALGANVARPSSAQAPLGAPPNVAPLGAPPNVAPLGAPPNVAPRGAPPNVAPLGAPPNVAPLGAPPHVAPRAVTAPTAPPVAPIGAPPNVAARAATAPIAQAGPPLGAPPSVIGGAASHAPLGSPPNVAPLSAGGAASHAPLGAPPNVAPLVAPPNVAPLGAPPNVAPLSAAPNAIGGAASHAPLGAPPNVAPLGAPPNVAPLGAPPNVAPLSAAASAIGGAASHGPIGGPPNVAASPGVGAPPAQPIASPAPAAPVPSPRASAPGGIAPPRISAEALAAPPRPSEGAAPKRTRRWPLVLALLVLLGGAAGAGVWIFLFGGRAMLGF